MNLLKHSPGNPPGELTGIRPEHLDVLPTAEHGQSWSVTVEAVELLGAERLIYARLNDEALIIRMSEDNLAPSPGDTLHVKPRADRLHRFDANTGQRLGN
jgi:sn-glycerol 3-phosphate transport system ATP-binding protein